MWRGDKHALDPATGKPGLLFSENDFDFFALERKRNEKALAAAAFVGGQTGEAVATVDQLVDRDLHSGNSNVYGTTGRNLDM